jgi:hypothetical protein
MVHPCLPYPDGFAGQVTKKLYPKNFSGDLKRKSVVKKPLSGAKRLCTISRPYAAKSGRRSLPSAASFLRYSSNVSRSSGTTRLPW